MSLQSAFQGVGLCRVPRWQRPRRHTHRVLGLLLAVTLATAGCSPILARLPLGQTPTPTAAPPSAPPQAQRPASVAPAPPDRLTVSVIAQPVVVLPTPDWPIPNGHFYTQTNGQPPRTSPTGFAVTDWDGIPFWSEYQRLGGPATVGYPVSARFEWQGRLTQVFQRAVFQWNEQLGRVQPANVLLLLEEAGKGDWLVKTRGVPQRLPSDFDKGMGRDQIVRERLALLNASQPLADKYHSAIDPLVLYGLPDSRVVDQGDHLAIRLQRTVLRLWKEDKPWAKAGEVTADSSGDIAVEAGLFPEDALRTEQPPVAPIGLDSAVVSPTPEPLPSVPAAPSVGAWRVANTDGDGVYLRRTPRMADKLRAWPEGTPLRSLGEQAQGDGRAWHRVQAPDGSTGWVPATYVEPAG